jgi:hypothetical protein
MTDRTAAALASALPAGITYTGPHRKQYSRDAIAGFLLRELESRGYRLVHVNNDGTIPVHLTDRQTFAEHTAEAMALIHDHVEGGEQA